MSDLAYPDSSFGSSEPFSGRFLELLGEAVGNAPPPEAGRIGRFDVLRELGRGGFGVVLEVYDPLTRCKRAMKVPHPRILESREEMGRFLDEAWKASRVDHPNVARLYEADNIGMLAYLVFELCPEGSLSDWLKRQEAPIPERWAALLVAEVADGVAAMHAAGLVHRDLKPGNILLVAVGNDRSHGLPAFRPKVTDFGIAKLMGDSRDLTKSGAIVGTIWAMSPEAAARRPKVIGPASDVYGLGVILYTVLTGRRLYEGLSDTQVLTQLQSEAPSPRPDDVRDGLSPALAAICRGALSKAPGDRYRSAADLAADLRRFADGERPVGLPLWVRTRARLRTRRRSLAAAVVAAVAVAGVLGAYFAKVRYDTAYWLRQVEAGAVSSLPSLMRARPPAGLVDERLAELFASGTDGQKLVASVAMAGTSPEYSTYAIRSLLHAPFDQVAPLARGLSLQWPGCIDRLIKESSPGMGTELGRANASLALVHLGELDRGLALFCRVDDPGGRARLVHSLGPSGVATGALIDALARRTEVRRGILLALGEVPDEAWTQGGHAEAESRALGLYRDDPDSGVHGAAKWLLRRWGGAAKLDAIDLALRGRDRGSKFGWRIGRSGITWVRVDVGDAVLEVADTEITVGFLRSYKLLPSGFPSTERPDWPARHIWYLHAATICNAIGSLEGIAAEGACYGDDGVPFADARARPGVRMPWDREFGAYARGGTGHDRPYGDAYTLADRYVWTTSGRLLQPEPAATVKPNDLGLFDVIGGLSELGEWTGPSSGPLIRTAVLGGNPTSRAADLSAKNIGGPHIVQRIPKLDSGYGVRIVRTLTPPKRPNAISRER